MKPIFLILGKSGSGKTTIQYELEAIMGLKPLASYTTRPKRSDDETSHTFVTDEEFDKLKNLVAYTEFDGYRYCATSAQVGRCDTYVIDSDGIDYFKEHYKGKKPVKIIYIDVSAVRRLWRMLRRGDGIIKSIRRIIHDHKAFKGAKDKADYIIKNNNKDRAVDIASMFIVGDCATTEDTNGSN